MRQKMKEDDDFINENKVILRNRKKQERYIIR